MNGFNTSVGEVGNAGLRANALLQPYALLRVAGRGTDAAMRVPSGGGDARTATQGAIAFSIAYPPAVLKDPQTPEYPVVTAALDNLPLQLPTGVLLADSVNVLGTFAFGMGAANNGQASIRVGHMATVFVDSAVVAGQAVYVVFPVPGDDLTKFPRAENGMIVPKVVAMDRLLGGNRIMNVLSRTSNAQAVHPSVAAAVKEFRAGITSFAYAVVARVLASMAEPRAVSTEDVDRVLGSAAFRSSDRGQTLSAVAAAIGVDGKGTGNVAKVIEQTFAEMFAAAPMKTGGDETVNMAVAMAMSQITNSLAFLDAYADRHFLGTAQTSANPRAGERAQCEVILRSQ